MKKYFQVTKSWKGAYMKFQLVAQLMDNTQKRLQNSLANMDYRLDISRKHLVFFISERLIKVKQYTGNTYIHMNMNTKLLRKLCLFWI